MGLIEQLLTRLRRVEPTQPKPVAPVEPTRTPAPASADAPKAKSANPEERRAKEIELLVQSFRRGIVDARFLELDVDRRFLEKFDVAVAERADDLALPPASALDVLRMVDEPQYPVKKIAGAIACEPALAGAVLTLANSPLHRGGERVETLPDAVARLGQKQLRLLLLEVALHSTRVKGRPFEQFSDMTWKHSLLAAQLAHAIAEAARVDPEHAAMAGLFHDVGVFAVLGVARQMALKSGRTVSKQSVLKLIAAHAEKFNERVVKKWNLSAAVAAAVVHRSRPKDAGAHAKLAAVAQLANDLCRQHGAWAPQRAVDLATHPALATLDLVADRLPRRDDVLVAAFKVEKVAQLQ